jgi:hypothetical protein
MSWFYRKAKLAPTSTRNEGVAEVSKIAEVKFDDTLTAMTMAGQTASINFSYPNIAIFASTATPWLTATTKAGTAGPGSLWLCSSGTLFIKTGSGATTGWICALAVAT